MKYVELCAGAGGSRAGLDAVGWTCVLAVDVDKDAAAVHALAFGDCELSDVRDLEASDLPDADALVAGFPCQPFSSSGHRSGFQHQSGNVFEHIAKLVSATTPRIVILENVHGLLHNKSGHTFSRVLQSLTDMDYVVDWLVADLRWFGPPQTRPRTLIIASREGFGGAIEMPNAPLASNPPLFDSAFSSLLSEFGIQMRIHQMGSLSEVEKRTRPAIGKAKSTEAMPFAKAGRAWGDSFVSLTYARPRHDFPVSPLLGDVVAPSFNHPNAIRSARYWAYDGPSSLHLRDSPISHCVGTSLGGAPLFAVPLGLVSDTGARAAFLEHSNWSREEDGYLVMRLRPERSVRLFGHHTEALESALYRFDGGSARKFVLVGNMMPPVMASRMGEIVSSALQEENPAPPVRSIAN
jgi:site-specific DNA-cytosine methylase